MCSSGFGFHFYHQSFHGYDLYGFSFIHERIAGRTPIFAFHKTFPPLASIGVKRVHSFSRHRSRRLRRDSVGCGYFPNCNRRSSGRDFFIWLPIKRLSLRSTNRWAMSLVRCCSITPSLLILVRKDCPSCLRIFTSRPRRKRSTRCVLSSSSSTPVPA